MGHGLRLSLTAGAAVPHRALGYLETRVEKWTDLVASDKDDGQRKGRGDVCLAWAVVFLLYV